MTAYANQVKDYLERYQTEVGDDGLDAAGVEALFTDVDEVVFTPWKGVFIPEAAQA